MLESMLCTDEDLLVDFVAVAPTTIPDQLKDKTLYTLDKTEHDRHGATCWTPALVTGNAKAVGDWTIAMRGDGRRQWLYNGKRVYAFVKETKPGDRGSDGFLHGS